MLAPGLGAYTDLSLVVNVTFSSDGHASVVEDVRVALNTPEELETFDYYATQGELSLTDWRRFSNNIAYHLRGLPVGTRVLATRDYTAGSSVGRVRVQYAINGTVTTQQAVGARTLRHTFTHESLAFEKVKGDLILLPRGATLNLILPDRALTTEADPAPARKTADTLTWEGPLASSWKVVFETEKPLVEEVNEYFRALYREALSPRGAWGILALFAGAGLVLWLWRGKPEGRA